MLHIITKLNRDKALAAAKNDEQNIKSYIKTIFAKAVRLDTPRAVRMFAMYDDKTDKIAVMPEIELLKHRTNYNDNIFFADSLGITLSDYIGKEKIENWKEREKKIDYDLTAEYLKNAEKIISDNLDRFGGETEYKQLLAWIENH